MKVSFLPIKKQLTALAALLVGFPAMLSLVGMYAAPHDIKGVVYRDFDANGTRQSTATYAEPGVPGVTVTAYGANGAEAAQTTTGADGTYTLDIAAAGDYRVEFTGLQTGDFSGAFGTGSGTSVQFVSGGAENVNLGINYPAQYSSSKDPRVLTSGFIAGNPEGGHEGHNTAILWTLPFGANGNHTAATGTDRGNISQSKDLGAIWGLAYAKRSKTAYVAAFTKRHVGFGPGGAGAIYKVPLANQTGASTPQVFYQFPNSAVGTGVHGTLNNNPGEATRDDAAFDNVGKTSLGDIDISDDDRSLYVVSLADRKLNVIDLTTDPVATPVSYDIPGPVGETWRPFAVKYYRGKVYVGVTVTNENSYNVTFNLNDRGNSAGMRGIVYEFNGSSFTQVLSFPLDEKKQPTNADLSAGNVPTTAPNENANERGHYWRPWTAVYRRDRIPATSGGSRVLSYAQPWLTDIEFDVNGEMILGIRDRFGDQIGHQNYLPTGSVTTADDASYSAIAPGQLLRAGKVALTGSEWQIESRGAVTHLGVTTTATEDQKKQFGPGGAGGTTYATNPSNVNVNSNAYFNRIVDGGSEGKFYWGDIVGTGGNHGSSSLGGVALLAGSNKLIMTAMDPTDLFNTGGLRRLHNSSGFQNNRAVVTTAGAADDNLNNTGGGAEGAGPNGNGARKGAVLFSSGVINWGKANGMGEVELLTDPAPIEIGNRVWSDTNGDGIQGAGEPAIKGVTVQLVNESDIVVATAVTDANGNYIFSSDPTRTSVEGDPYIYNLPLVYGAKYKVRVPDVIGETKQTALGPDRLTLANQGGGNPVGDTRDSDGEPVENKTYAETALFTLGDAGENDHTHDFGFIPLGALGDYVWIDTDSDGIQDVSEIGLNDVTVTLYKKNDSDEFVPYGTPQQTRTEAGKAGYYWFSELPEGEYVVHFDLPEGYKFTEAGNGTDDADSDANTTPGADFGRSQVVTIDPSKPLDDLERINPTIDAGVVPVGALGDYVWIDTDSDGIQDASEIGLNDVTVTLYKKNDSDEFVPYGTPQQTRPEAGKDGYYWFGDLPEGEYVVHFELPEGYKFTEAGNGTDDADSDANTTPGADFGRSQVVTINPSKPLDDLERINPTIDAGVVPVGALGDYVWIDTDSDGIQDASEIGRNDVTVTLYKKNDSDEFVPYGAPQQTRTEAGKDGYYWFGDLPSGEYQVGFSNLPPGYGFTDQNQGVDDSEDSDADPVTGRSQTVTINTSKPLDDLERINPTIDAGIVPVGSIGDYVWHDTDLDGTQDENEQGVDGVTVELYVWEGDESTGEYVLKQTTVTKTEAGKKGYYHFPNLLTGKYKVKFVKSTLPTGYEFTHQDKDGVDDQEDSDADRTTGESGDITINTSLPVENIGRNNPTIDAGLVPEGALPVKLVQFGAVKEGATAKISWRTTSELNASHFEILRSGDARTWSKIGTVAATGSETTISRYTFSDGSPVKGINFYRLRAVDLDGTSESSKIVSLDFSKDVAKAAYVYPNPASESIRFSSDLDLGRVKSVSVADIRGNVVYTAGSIATEGIPAARFGAGLHIIRVRMDDGTTRDFKVVIAPKK